MSRMSPTNAPDRSPYTDDTLSPEAKADLSVLVHFVLLFNKPLGLSPYELLHSHAEASLLSQTGRPFDALVSFLTSASKTSRKTFLVHLSQHTTPGAKLTHLRDLTDSYAHHVDLRKFITSEDGRVLPAARLRVGARDSSSVSYTWLRGPDGCCSDRIVAASNTKDCRVLRSNEAFQVVTGLESGNRRRHDLLTAGWLRERIDRSASRCNRVQKAEEERIKKQERARNKSGLIGGLQVDIVGCGRGRRERKSVCYEEDDFEEDVDEDEEMDDDEEDFVVESGSEEDSDDSQDEAEESDAEEGWISHPAAAGRRRVRPSNGRTRSHVAFEDDGRAVRKSTRVLRNSLV